jgi:hypothetical protein
MVLSTEPASAANPTVGSLQQRIFDNSCSGTETTVAVGGTIDTQTICLEANVTADSGLTIRLEVEVQPVGTSFSNTVTVPNCSPSDCIGTLAQGTHVVTIGGLAYGTGYHWQVRGVDNAGAFSAWSSFATNGESSADFTPVNTAPTVGSLQQRIFDGSCGGTETTVAVNGSINTQAICLEANVSDAPGSTVRLEVEVKPVGTSFDGTTTNGFFGVVGTKVLTVTGLTYGTSYRWQARGVDNQGGIGAWSSFATNDVTSGIDFTPVNAAPTVGSLQQRIFDGACNGTETTVAVGGSVNTQAICLEANVSDARAAPFVLKSR